jgi:hypothetical protein
MPCPPRTSHDRHHAAGSRVVELTSSRPAPSTRPIRAGIHAQTCRSRRPSPRAISCYGESFASSTFARSSSTSCCSWAPLLVGRCNARLALTTRIGPDISCFLRFALASRIAYPGDQHYLGRHAGSRKGRRAQHHRHVAKSRFGPPSGGRLPASDDPVSRFATSPMVFVHEFTYDFVIGYDASPLACRDRW